MLKIAVLGLVICYDPSETVSANCLMKFNNNNRKNNILVVILLFVRDCGSYREIKLLKTGMKIIEKVFVRNLS